MGMARFTKPSPRPDGILAVKDGAFDAALESHIGKWDKKLPIMASGMITSRQGWVELPYVACPAGLQAIAAAVHLHTSKHGRKIYFVPGISTRGLDGAPDVIRGEETQVLGATEGGSEHFVTPGTHSKWITVKDREITGFSSYMTGEVFALLKTHSILGKLMTGEMEILQLSSAASVPACATRRDSCTIFSQPAPWRFSTKCQPAISAPIFPAR